MTSEPAGRAEGEGWVREDKEGKRPPAKSQAVEAASRENIARAGAESSSPGGREAGRRARRAPALCFFPGDSTFIGRAQCFRKQLLTSKGEVRVSAF